MHKVYGTNRKFALHSLPTRVDVFVHVHCNFSLLCPGSIFFAASSSTKEWLVFSCLYLRKLFFILVHFHATSLVRRLRWHRNPHRLWWPRNTDGLRWHRNTNGLRWHTQHECAKKRVHAFTYRGGGVQWYNAMLKEYYVLLGSDSINRVQER